MSAISFAQISVFKVFSITYPVGLLGEVAAENDVRLLCGKGAILFVQRRVARIVHRVERLHAVAPFSRVFPRNHGLRRLVNFIAEHLEMFVFDDARVGHFARGVVHHRIALPIRRVERLGLEPHRAVFQPSETIVVIFVDFSREHDFLRHRFPMRPVGEEIHAGLYLYAVEQPFNQCIIAADKNT